MPAYYNEHDPKAAAWLRELIRGGLIAPGEVDERDIQDILPGDLAGFTQCHFFAGIGVWSYALRLARWPDDKPVWTGSCPCQPFSAAGKRKGTADERHLWPAWFHLIEQCAPRVVFGEQVASKDGLAWLDFVHADLENAGYAVGPIDICAASIGAPHMRQRLYFVADAMLAGRPEGRTVARQRPAASSSSSGGLGNNNNTRLEGLGFGHQAEDGRIGAVRPVAETGESRRLADTDGRNASAEGVQRGGEHGQQPKDTSDSNEDNRPGPTNSYWRAADWLYCRDGKWRPVEPGTFPLAHGTPARVGRLRGYGNAIIAQAAAEVIAAYLEQEGLV